MLGSHAITNFFFKIFHYLDVPKAPGKPKASDINATEMTVTWSAPESDGGSPITGYYVERKEATSTRWMKVNKQPVSETTLRIKDLIEKSEYQFRVSAENKAGVGPASEPSDLYMAKPPYGKHFLKFVEHKIIRYVF